jgi:hypothetical protein
MKTPTRKEQQGSEYYIVPARHLSGTRDEVLQQIDELIQGLIGLRQLVIARAEAGRCTKAQLAVGQEIH